MIKMKPLRRTYGNGRKVADKERSSALVTLGDGDTTRASEQDYNLCSLSQRNMLQRCVYFTILSPEANGEWKAVAVPLECLIFSTRAGSGSQSFTDKTLSEPDNHQCESKALISKAINGNGSPGESATQSSINYDGFDVTNLSNINIGTSKLGKPRVRNKRKKAKKKAKRDRKLSLYAASVEFSSKNTESTSSISCESTPTVLSPDSSTNTSEDTNGGNDEVDLLETSSSGSLYESLSCERNSGFGVLSEAKDTLVLDSIAVYSDADISSSSGVDMKYELSEEVPRNSSIFCSKVCGNDSDDYRSGLGKVESFYSEKTYTLEIASFDDGLNVSQSKILSTSKNKNQSEVENLGKFQARTCAVSMQEFNCVSNRLPDASKSTSKLCTNIGMKLCDRVDISRYLGQEKGSIGISKFISEADCRRTESETELIVHDTCERFHQLEVFSSKVEPLEEFDSTSSYSLHDLAVKQECNLNSSHCVDKEVVESSKLSNNAIETHCVDKEAVESSKLGNNAIEKPLSEAFDYSVNSSTKCFAQDSVETVDYEVTNMIKQTINDVQQAQLASEAFEMSIGCPVAEVEKFLRAASPVINLPNNISHCREASGAPLSRHEMPNLSLGNLWQWYEKHGAFGLEIKVEDCENSKRLGVDRFSFLAYFVPFLSAIQIFSPGRKLPENSSRRSGLQIFSMLVPRSRIMSDAVEQFVDSTSPDEAELVYEYFESEQPQQRRPLFDMIKHLSSGNEPLQVGAFGDPSKLVSGAINDLHPKSWYSVAWYPIYRIPGEKFHSAFLTYHSLGHLTGGSASVKSLSGNVPVVFPIVGLQSYNTQGECWLKPRNLNPSQIKAIPDLNHCEILKQRLRTLEHTASVMARAEVIKGNTISVNKQSDYEFFLSRRR